MKLAIIQYTPSFKEREKSEAKVDTILSGLNPGEVDLIILPEMAMVGYMFEDAEEVKPFLEDALTGPTATWARKQAQRLHAGVLVGFAEKGQDGNAYNSTMLVYYTRSSQEATPPYIYRKHFLYSVDRTWASPGQGFETIKLQSTQIGVGICMDLNVHESGERKMHGDEYDPELMESYSMPPPFASYHAEQQTRLILCPMNWRCHPSEAPVERMCVGSMSYWLGRLEPLYVPGEHPTTFVACNRTGVERGVTFCGTSCVFDFVPGQDPVVRKAMGKAEEGYCVVDIAIDVAFDGSASQGTVHGI